MAAACTNGNRNRTGRNGGKPNSKHELVVALIGAGATEREASAIVLTLSARTLGMKESIDTLRKNLKDSHRLMREALAEIRKELGLDEALGTNNKKDEPAK